MTTADTFSQNLQRQIEYEVALHYVNSPAHAHASLSQLSGVVATLLATLPDDPALAAYALRDALPRIFGRTVALKHWSDRVIEADPGDVPSTGARLLA